MQFSVSKMCRGQGVAYFLCSIKHLQTRTNHVIFSASSEKGISLPLEVYKLPSDDIDGDGFGCILVTPLLDTVYVRLSAAEYNENRTLVSCERKSISRRRLKWSSRLSYRLSYEEAKHIRDTDRYTFSNQIHINLLSCNMVPGKGEIVAKAMICTPKDDVTPCVKLLHGDGSEVNDFSPWVGLPQRTVIHEGVVRYETQITVRIPDDGQAYCLVAEGKQGSRSGFLCFDMDSRRYYLDRYRSPYYRAADNEVWKHAMADRRRRLELADPRDFDVPAGPTFSIVVPLYNTPVRYLTELISSVQEQLYRRWELVLVNATPDNKQLGDALNSLADQRLKIVTLSKNLGISGNTNAGIDAATGDFICFLDHDDTLDKLALYRYALEYRKDPSIDWFYSDEDNLTPDGDYVNPSFKSCFNIDLLRCHNYITHFVAVRACLAKRLKLRADFDGAQDYDFLLRLCEITQNVVHVPEALYHWRMSENSVAANADNKDYAEQAGLHALEEHFKRLHLTSARVETSAIKFLYHTYYEVDGDPLVSIIIPSKDNAEVLDRCLTSIEQKTTYRNIEVVIVENNSTEPKTFDYYKKACEQWENVRVVTWEHEFNFAKIINYGVEHARGSYVLMLNNDTEVITPTWLESMLGFCQRKDVGIVGAKLLYPDDTVQHVGVATTYNEALTGICGPEHIFINLDADDPGYRNRAIYPQDVSMVTGACLLVDRDVFEEVGGMTERYTVAYNDVDFCLKVRKAGHLVVIDTDARLYHYESLSRGSDLKPEKRVRFIHEQGLLRADWPEVFATYDPYYSKFVN